MKSFQLRKLFLNFFEKRGHKVYPSSSLIPADPTSLFTSAGMQQFVPYLSGKVEPIRKRACSVQKCLRVDDIDKVGDRYHHTFFEMLGNWSFGDYFKEGAIDFALEFLIDNLKLDKDRIWVSVFKGEKGIPKDEKSIKIWQNRGIKRERIFEFSMEENFWGPVTKTGPCGPCSEIYYDLTKVPCQKGKNCGPNCQCGRFIEVWNLVFMEYNKTKEGKFEKLPKQNVDTGIGFERLLSILQKTPSDYETDLFFPIIIEIERQSFKKYKGEERIFRISADHLRAVSFLIGEGVLPSNIERGYVLRMLLRRIIRYAKSLDLLANWYVSPIKKISEIYGKEYPEVKTKQTDILTVIQSEEEKFEKSLEKGIKEFEKLLKNKVLEKAKIISGKEAFDLYQSYGFPLELTKEMAREKGFGVDEVGFKKAFERHREISKVGVERKFGGVGIEELKTKEEREKATKLHTATHLLQVALRETLGEQVKQMGSDITPERLRFDFSHPKKLEKKELERIEDLVNQKIKEELMVKRVKMPYEEAIKSGALAFFKEKYPEEVFVYTIEDEKGKVFSKEICGGPHVKRISELGVFRIEKEESAGAGVRRIKAILEEKI